MADEYAQVVVIGAGAMGAAAAYHLARRGADVAAFDRFDVPNAMGSSGGESRMIRMCYYEHPDYVPLLRRSYELWGELTDEAHQPILEVTRGLFVGTAASALVSGAMKAAKEHGLDHDVLTNADLRQQFAQFVVDDDMVALLEPSAGFIRPEMAVAAHARLAIQHGARVYANEAVIEWHADREAITVVTAGRTLRAESLLLCAGAWTSQLVREFGVRLAVTRQVLAWVMPDDAALFTLGSCPVWAVEHSGGDFHYGFPILDASRGLKVGRHAPAMRADPDRVVRTPQAGDEDTVRPFLRRYVPGADGGLREMTVCLYTNSPDAHFIIDRHPGHPRVYVACGFSGHGFKFAPVIGEALADLALTGTTSLPVGFLGLSRFNGVRS